MSNEQDIKKQEANAAALEKLESGANEFKQAEEQELIVDLDEAMDEWAKDNPPMIFKIGDIRYEVSRDCPVKVVTWYQRNVAKGGNINETKSLQLLDLIFEKEILDKLAEKNATLPFMVEKLLTPVLKSWGFYGSTDNKKK